jgi:hypothetical protein
MPTAALPRPRGAWLAPRGTDRFSPACPGFFNWSFLPRVRSLATPAEMPERDEALKALVARFKADPDGTFAALADALLSRGHAFEALRVSEHGLDRNPGHLEGRIERARALIAAGRPKVAYVELQRCLALAPEDRRTLRLLGQVYKEAGAPERAADLLARRSHHERLKVPESAPSAPLAEPVPAAPPTRPLFFDLAADLGLQVAPRKGPPRRIEVTQVIRRKQAPRPPRTHSELRSIEGPIVDATQPGQVEEMPQPDGTETTEETLAPIFAPDTLAPVEDEPLTLEGQDFQLQPVETGDLWLEDEPGLGVPPPTSNQQAQGDDGLPLPPTDPGVPIPDEDGLSTWPPVDPPPPLSDIHSDEPSDRSREPSGPRAERSTPRPAETSSETGRGRLTAASPSAPPHPEGPPSPGRGPPNAVPLDPRAMGLEPGPIPTADLPGVIQERRSWRVPALTVRTVEPTPRARIRRWIGVGLLAAYTAGGVWLGWSRFSSWLAAPNGIASPTERVSSP